MDKMKTFRLNLINTKVVCFLALAFGIIAWIISYRYGFVLTYNDGASHLNIARRILDNYTPGLAQIGTVWLPLPHILMFFFAWNDFLWHTALAGSIVSISAYVLCIVFAYKLVLEITNKKLAGLLTALIIGLNPNLLYLQTTPMTETLLLATFILSAYFLCRYTKDQKILYLIGTGICVMLSTLIRYDGWFLFASLIVMVPLWAVFNRGARKAEGDFFLFATIGGLGIVLWILWNWTIFGEPFYFLFGPYSAYAQQKVLSSVGQLPTQKNLMNSITYYGWSVIDVNGLLLVATASLSMLLIPFVVSFKKHLHLILLLLTPLAFNIIALYAGQSAMDVPQAAHNPGLFNIRYGLMMLPAIGVVLGIIAGKIRYAWIGVLILLCVQSNLFIHAGYPITLQDGVNGLKNTYYTVEASKWLRENYHGGLILTSLASHDAFVARAQINMRNYIQEGNAGYWENALKNPSKNIEYIALLTFPPDSVYRKLKNNEDFIKNYHLVHAYQTFEIYQRNY